jgi:predicted GNAT superfamily acetyltransferase
MTIEFRELRTADELVVLPEFEKLIWGGESEMVSVNVLVATISEGGMAIGAFEADRLVGAVYGFATSEPHVLHSHYLAVDPTHRRNGLGANLKYRQREWCLARGVTAMRWTFDPLQLANAHLNMRTLGATGVSYHVDLYGTLGGINGSLPSDRVTVVWDLLGSRTRVNAQVGAGVEVEVQPVSAEEIASSAPQAHAARHALREALMPLLADGWRMTDIDREGRRYTLAR